MVRSWLKASAFALLLVGCGPNPNEEPIQTTLRDECEGPAELSYSRSGGFEIRVAPCQGKTGVWGPILYGEDERVVKQEIDNALKKFKFRCRLVTITGTKTGASSNDYECQRVS